MWALLATVFCMAAIAAVIALIVVHGRRQRLLATLAQTHAERHRLLERQATLEQRVAALAPYEAIVDARAEAAAIVAAAAADGQARLNGASVEAARVVGAAQAEAARLVAEKQQEVDALLSAARTEATAARAEAEQIVTRAKSQSMELARAGHESRERLRHLEETARAMQNVIEGYGDRYLVPTMGLLDELADEFGSREGGERLKAARANVRKMVKERDAVICDYAEANRKETAENFILDAFNGKVEAVLTDVRHDNYGTLERKLRDAFALVNENGRAFRNARIKPAYLEARIEELRWAVVVHELKQQEREDQRRIREQIREEEKARRDYERAMKEAEKEEDLLRKAMEKARKEFDKAGDAQKAMYEQQLLALAEKLKAAEEKNQRAMSMAQQTKAGHVYIISNVGSFGDDVFKVGMTRRLEPLDRIDELGDASVPFDFDVHAMIQCDDAPALEHALHKRFVRSQVNKVNARKEFFRVGLRELRAEIERLGVAAAWTMTAECREWKETRAIEEAMKTRSFDEQRWARQQVEAHDRAMQGGAEAIE